MMVHMWNSSHVRPLSRKSSKIHRRIGHVTAKYNNFIIVWGGYEERIVEEDEPFHFPNRTRYHSPKEILLYDTEYEVWHLAETVGNIPPKLCGSTAAVCHNSMYLYGGFCEHLVAQNSCNVQSLYQLRLDRMEWRLLHPAGLSPLACDKLVSWCYNGDFYVLGGFGPWPDSASDYSAVTFRVDPRANDQRGWNNQLVRYRPADDRWHWPAAGGQPPGPRAAHAAALLHGRLYVFGGRMGRRLNDLYCLDMDTMCWSALEPQDPSWLVPQGRSWHSLTPLLRDQLLVYGGFNERDEPLDDPWVYEVVAARWRPVRYWLPAPAVRMWHAAAPAAPGEVLVVGGLECSIFSPEPSRYASSLVVVRRIPKSLLRLCLDAVERFRSELLPALFVLPQPLLDRVQARLAASS